VKEVLVKAKVVRKVLRPDIGIALIDLDRSQA